MKNKPIIINEDTRVVIEDGNFCIQKRFQAKKTGVVRWDVDGYFPSMEHCAMELLNTLPAASNKLTGELQSIVSAVNQAKKEILAALKQK
jgi:hypothetical protein